MLHQRPRWQHLPVAALTQAVKPDIGSESQFLPSPPAFDAPVRWVPVELPSRLVWKKLEWCGYPTVKKNWISLFVLTQCMNVTDTHTQTDTHRMTARPCLCIASCGKNLREWWIKSNLLSVYKSCAKEIEDDVLIAVYCTANTEECVDYTFVVSLLVNVACSIDVSWFSVFSSTVTRGLQSWWIDWVN